MINFLKKLFRGKKSDPIVVGYQPLPRTKMAPPPMPRVAPARSNSRPSAFAAPYGRAAAPRSGATSSSTPRRTESSSDDLSNPLNPMSPLSPLSPMNQLSASSAVSEPSHRSSHCSSHSSHDTSSSTTHSSHDHSPSHSSHDYSCSSSSDSGSSYDSSSASVSSD